MDIVIQYCIMDNQNGPLCYCYDEHQANNLILALNASYAASASSEKEFKRFAYEKISEYDDELKLLLKKQFLGSFR